MPKQVRRTTEQWTKPTHESGFSQGQAPKGVRSTAAILAQGVSLQQVQQAVSRLRPKVERVS